MELIHFDNLKKSSIFSINSESGKAMKQLTLSQKISYAMGGLALNFANLVISQWLLKLYVPSQDKALVGGFLFSIIFLVGRIVDGITDPLIGYWSDHLKSKRGRRIPFILWGFIPVAIVSFLLWVPPFPEQKHWFNAVYIFVLVQLFFIFWTIIANPYLSLLPEITSDLKERVNISTMQAGFIMAGTLLFGVMGPLKQSFGWIGIGIITGAITIISFLPTLIKIKQKSTIEDNIESAVKEKYQLGIIFQWARTTFKNRSFIFLLTATSLFWFSLNLIILVIPFFVQYVLFQTDNEVVLLMLPFLLANLVFFFVFNFLAKKYGKYRIFLIVLLGSALTMPLLFFVGDIPWIDPMLQTEITMGLIGTFVAGFMMLPFAILSDVIDYDEQLTGKRREGIYFGIQSIFQKTSIGVSISAATYIMYIGSENEPNPLGLKFIPVLAGVFALLAFIVFLKYPIREKEGKIYLLPDKKGKGSD